jgi:hypothetical protein
LVDVFNPWRDIEPDPEQRGKAPMGTLENHDPRGLSMFNALISRFQAGAMRGLGLGPCAFLRRQPSRIRDERSNAPSDHPNHPYQIL